MPLGYFLRLNAPLEYELIIQIVGINGVPDADLIEAISYSSTNLYFRTEDFRRHLIRYRNEGCYAEHPKPNPGMHARAMARNRRKIWLKDSIEKV